jgi:hypothetical protein
MSLSIKIKIPACLVRILTFPLLIFLKLRYGPSARFIYIARLKFAIVDASLYDRLRCYNWRLNRSNRTWYACATLYVGSRRPHKLIWMHHLVLPPPPGLLIDHHNHNGLDNRLTNLRPASHAQNVQNTRKQKPKSSSKYKGVDYVKATGKFRARIKIADRRLFLGSFISEIDAAVAYNNAAKQYFGEFACLNELKCIKRKAESPAS